MVVVIVLTFEGLFASGCRSHVISIGLVSAVARAVNKYRRTFCKIAELFSRLSFPDLQFTDLGTTLGA